MIIRPVIAVAWIFALCAFAPAVNANEAGDSQNLELKSSSSFEQLNDLALNGSARAQYELGLLYEYGRDVSQDDDLAAHWYEKSAAQFFPDALYRLAILYDNGWGPALNKDKAFFLYKTAAENGHSLAQHDVAIMYFKGIGTPKSLMEAYKWLKIAVIGGNSLMEKHLLLVAKEMSSDEIEVAEYLAEEWNSYSGN